MYISVTLLNSSRTIIMKTISHTELGQVKDLTAHCIAYRALKRSVTGKETARYVRQRARLWALVSGLGNDYRTPWQVSADVYTRA
jgi:hypothetical protein